MESTIQNKQPEEPKQQKKQLTRQDYLKRYVKPHRKKCHEVKEKHLKRLIKEAHILYNLCFTQRGKYPSAFAMAHPQITKKKPLRFFVTAKQEIIINPIIKQHTGSICDCQSAINCTHSKHFSYENEGCMTFPDRLLITVPRWIKCEVEFNTLKKDGSLSERMTKNLSGKEARIFQHEIDHLNFIYIYDIEKGGETK